MRRRRLTFLASRNLAPTLFLVPPKALLSVRTRAQERLSLCCQHVHHPRQTRMLALQALRLSTQASLLHSQQLSRLSKQFLQ